jgi:hypothetical protein
MGTVELVYVGRLSGEKGAYELMLKVLSLADQSCTFRAHFFGEIDDKRVAQLFCQHSGCLFHYGWSSNPWREVKALYMPISINYSRVEVMGYSIYESMQNQIPILATPTQGANTFLSSLPKLIFTTTNPSNDEVLCRINEIRLSYSIFANAVRKVALQHTHNDLNTLAMWAQILS